MSDTLCRWLNQELQLSKALEPRNIARDFSNGYLFGEILHKHEVQHDFRLFLKKNTSIAKVNNFTRLEPTLKLLGISFDKNTAKDLMQEKEGAAIGLLYQLYVLLNKKDTEVSSALPREVKPHVGLKLPKISQCCEDKCQQMEYKSVIPPIQQKKPPQVQYGTRMKSSEKVIQTEFARLEKSRRELNICGFDSMSSGLLFPEDIPLGSTKQGCEAPGSGNKLIFQSSRKDIQRIRLQSNENYGVLDWKEIRVNAFLVEQFKAHEAQQMEQQEQQMVRHLTQQTKLERRLMAQLMQIRKQKAVILENHLFREQQYIQRRKNDIQEALNRKAVLAQHAKLAREEKIRKDVELCNRIAAQSRQERYFESFKDMLGQIADLAIKVGGYRLITGNLIPDKLKKEWKEFFVRGIPLHEPVKINQPEIESSTSLDPTELRKQEILNNLDYDEYINMVGEWAWPVEERRPNIFLEQVVQQLRKIVYPPIVESLSPLLPNFTIKACVLGKCCSGKTTCLVKIAEALSIHVLLADTLIEEALKTCKTGEELSKNSIPDELLVDIMVKAISQLPAESDWILDGFPCNIIQAHLLEKALGGSVGEENETVENRTNLAADPDLLKLPLRPAPILDVALLLDSPDECVMRRAYSHCDTAATTSQPIDENLYLAHVLSRITAFHNAWPDLEEWFGEKQNILVHVRADVDEGELCSVVESILQQVIKKKHEENPALDSAKALGTSSASEIQPPALTDENLGLTESYSSLKEETHQKQTGNVSPSSLLDEDTRGVSKNQSKSVSSIPGSVCQPYEEKPIPLEMAEFLCSFWDNACMSYVKNIKRVMEQLRSCLVFDQDIVNIRERHKHYLSNVQKLQQESVHQWQKDLSSIHDDMRDDEDTKAELHLRLDELLKKPRDIIDNYKYQSEQEISILKRNDWLEAQFALLITHHSELMKVELSHFCETVCFLKVYYWDMHRQVPIESASESISQLKTTVDKYWDECHSFRRPISSRSVSVESEHVEPTHKKFMSACKEVLEVINRLVSTEAQQRETMKQEEEKAMKKDSASAKQAKNKNKKQSAKKQTEESKMTQDQEIRERIFNEYITTLTHEAKATKVRIELVKHHGLVLMQSLQSRAQETCNNEEKLIQTCHQSESIDQLSDDKCHNIEIYAKLQNEVVLEEHNFYMNRDSHLVSSSTPPSSPPLLEDPVRSTPTIPHLESLHHQEYNIAPSEIVSSFEFVGFREDDIPNSRDSNILPWANMDETQVYSVKDHRSDHICLHASNQEESTTGREERSLVVTQERRLLID